LVHVAYPSRAVSKPTPLASGVTAAPAVTFYPNVLASL
jgi:hypothetical protein